MMMFLKNKIVIGYGNRISNIIFISVYVTTKLIYRHGIIMPNPYPLRYSLYDFTIPLFSALCCSHSNSFSALPLTSCLPSTAVSMVAYLVSINVCSTLRALSCIEYNVSIRFRFVISGYFNENNPMWIGVGTCSGRVGFNPHKCSLF